MVNLISLIPVYVIIGIAGAMAVVAGMDAIGSNSNMIGQWLLIFGGILVVTSVVMLYSYNGETAAVKKV